MYIGISEYVGICTKATSTEGEALVPRLLHIHIVAAGTVEHGLAEKAAMSFNVSIAMNRTGITARAINAEIATSIITATLSVEKEFAAIDQDVSISFNVRNHVMIRMLEILIAVSATKDRIANLSTKDIHISVARILQSCNFAHVTIVAATEDKVLHLGILLDGDAGRTIDRCHIFHAIALSGFTIVATFASTKDIAFDNTSRNLNVGVAIYL